MAAGRTVLLVSMVVLLASCNTWESRPVDGGATKDASAAMAADSSGDVGEGDASTDGIDASGDGGDQNGTDAPAMEDAGASHDAGDGGDVAPGGDTGGSADSHPDAVHDA